MVVLLALKPVTPVMKEKHNEMDRIKTEMI
jgi:hypothetical protein